MMVASNNILTTRERDDIDSWLKRYPKGKSQSALLAALRAVMHEDHYLSTEKMDAVADYLGLPKIAVYEVASFYSMFELDEKAAGNGVRYSIVDMSLNGGLGGVTSIKNILLMGNTTEKITAVRHANNSDIWVICHKWNSNQFQAFLINGCSGLQTTPVISNVGSVHNHTTNYLYLEKMGQS